MKDILAFNRPSFSRLITYEDSGCGSRDLMSQKLNILKRKREFGKKNQKHPQSFQAEEDIRGATRFCWKCRGGPLVITEVNMPSDTLMFNTVVFAAVYQVLLLCGTEEVGEAPPLLLVFLFFHAENSALALTVTRHNETWMLPGSGSGDACRGRTLSLPNQHIVMSFKVRGNTASTERLTRVRTHSINNITAY